MKFFFFMVCLNNNDLWSISYVLCCWCCKTTTYICSIQLHSTHTQFKFNQLFFFLEFKKSVIEGGGMCTLCSVIYWIPIWVNYWRWKVRMFVGKNRERVCCVFERARERMRMKGRVKSVWSILVLWVCEAS